ncbi:MAG TPA: hypothetical protein VFH03_01760 [Actinoplanes sp.]|nr:hypothetical protein [Actinoplanes sp.]
MTALVAAAMATVGAAPPAQAVAATSAVTLNAGPEPVPAGAMVTLSGTAGRGTTGNGGVVRFYFRKWNATTATFITSARVAASGKFTKQTRQSTSGYWHAVYGGNSVRRTATSAVDYVEARAWRNVPRVRFNRTGTGGYTSPVLTWSTDRLASVAVLLRCPAGSTSNYLSVSWNGKPNFGWDGAWFEPANDGTSLSASTHIDPTEKTGYIRVTAQLGCTWTVKISQSVRSYVKV